MLKIDYAEIQKICGHAAGEYPGECCGILLGNREIGQVQEIYQAGNVDPIDRQNIHFLINPLELYKVEKEAEKSGMEVIGFYHSHTDYPAVLSKEDISSMIAGCFYMIVSVMNGICTEIKSYMKTGFQDEVCETKIDMDY